MKLEVLVATMHQKDHNLVEKINIQNLNIKAAKLSFCLLMKEE